MAHLSARVGRGGTGADRALTGQAAATVVAPVPLAASLPGAPQVAVQLAACSLVRPDVAVNRLVADRELLRAAESARHLLRAPVLAQQRLDPLPVARRKPPVASRPRASPSCVPVGELRAVGGVAPGAIAPDLAPDGAAVAPEQAGDRGGGEAPLPQQAQGVPFREGDLVIR